MKICPACGKVNEDDKNFCPVCGTELKTASPQPTNTIDEINLVNTRLRSVPQKPKSNAKYGIIIGALGAIIVIMIVVIVRVIASSNPTSQADINFNTPIVEQSTITIGEERYYKPKSDKLFPDIIRFANNCVYLEFGFQEALYYGKADYTVSGNTITLGSVDLEKFKAGGEIVIIGENPNFPEVHIMDEGAKLEYNDTAITIVDFESHWVLKDRYFEYPEEYKDGAVHYLTDDPEKLKSTEVAPHQNDLTAKSNIYFAETGKSLCYTEEKYSPNPTIIQLYDDYIYIIFPFFEGMYYARAEYSRIANMVTLDSVDLYMTNFGESPLVKGVHANFHDVHVMDPGARLRFDSDNTITVIDFENYWVLKEDSFNCPDEFTNGKTLYLTSTPYEDVTLKEEKSYEKATTKDITIIDDEGGQKYFYAPDGYPYGDHLYFDSDYVYLYFGYYDMLCLARGTYSTSGNKITIGSVDLYCDLTADGEAYVHKGEAPQRHIMDAGATIEYNESNITISGFKARWALDYNLEIDSFPENYEDGSVLNKYS